MLTDDELMDVLRASKGKSVLAFGRQVEGATLRAAAERGPICGENAVMDADLTGCGKAIEKQTDVYRCTHCGVPFHRDCAERHFATDTAEHSANMVEEQIRRLDSKTRRADVNACSALGGVCEWPQTCEERGSCAYGVNVKGPDHG